MIELYTARRVYANRVSLAVADGHFKKGIRRMIRENRP
jgi:hypothetical protein